MKRWILYLTCALLLTGCTRYEPIELPQPENPTESAQEAAQNESIRSTYRDGSGAAGPVDKTGFASSADGSGTIGSADLSGAGGMIIDEADLTRAVLSFMHLPDIESLKPVRTPVKVKGIYVSAYVAGDKAMMDHIIQEIDETELNAVVIDFKDDNGRITTPIDCQAFNDIDACVNYVPDMKALIKNLKEHNIYVIARVVTFRDPYLAEKRQDLSLKTADGTIYRDKKGLAWVDPYNQEVWDYLVQVGLQAADMGFDEIQFDYIRFSTDSTMKNVVFDENEVKGRSRTDIITDFTNYIYDKLTPTGVFVSADVFGAVIDSHQDAERVGQIYGDMAANLDYICPMIYPSHYNDGNFGLDHPDLHPYESVRGALQKSEEALKEHQRAEVHHQGQSQAIVRPWLQDFTASYLKHYIRYGDEQVRQEIQAVYDAGYDEWILWSAANKYHYGALERETEPEAQTTANEQQTQQ